MSENEKPQLIEVATGNNLGALDGTKGDLTFPDRVRGWADVLDCRHGRYLKMSLEDIRHEAEHVRKYYLVMHESQL